MQRQRPTNYAVARHRTAAIGCVLEFVLPVAYKIIIVYASFCGRRECLRECEQLALRVVCSVPVYVCTCAHAHMCTCVHACVRVHVHACGGASERACMHACIHAGVLRAGERAGGRASDRTCIRE